MYSWNLDTILILVYVGKCYQSIYSVTKNVFVTFQHGMGKLRITESGLQLQGVAEFTDTLYAQNVASEQVYI